MFFVWFSLLATSRKSPVLITYPIRLQARRYLYERSCIHSTAVDPCNGAALCLVSAVCALAPLLACAQNTRAASQSPSCASFTSSTVYTALEWLFNAIIFLSIQKFATADGTRTPDHRRAYLCRRWRRTRRATGCCAPILNFADAAPDEP